jgi:hypothetical protein
VPQSSALKMLNMRKSIERYCALKHGKFQKHPLSKYDIEIMYINVVHHLQGIFPTLGNVKNNAFFN